MTSPPLSVVMPVRNAAAFLAESIESILSQTFGAFEFVILDDASTDDSWPLLQAWSARDARIRLHRSAQPLGLVGSANAVVHHARGSVIARMDADDISHPDRLSRQMHLLDRRADVAAVGTLCIGIDQAGRFVRPRDRWRLVRRSAYQPFPHGSAMVRRDAFEAIGGYRDAGDLPEDADFFLRLATRWPVVSLPDVLYFYRYHATNSTLAVETDCPAHGNPDRREAAILAVQAMRLWAGGHTGEPRSARSPGHRLLRRWTLRRLAYASWGRWHPPSLRATLRAVIKLRDEIAGLAIKEGQAYRWRCE